MMLMIALAVGIVSGLRTMTSVAAVSWGARRGLLALAGTHLAFLGFAATPYILTLAAVGELVRDKLPSTPSRKAPIQLAGRVLSGALAGGAIGASTNSLWLGILMGVIGSLTGTYGGSAIRSRLALAFGTDLPAALLEDATAILLALVAVSRLA